jgi:hypothetical protein
MDRQTQRRLPFLVTSCSFCRVCHRSIGRLLEGLSARIFLTQVLWSSLGILDIPSKRVNRIGSCGFHGRSIVVVALLTVTTAMLFFCEAISLKHVAKDIPICYVKYYTIHVCTRSRSPRRRQQRRPEHHSRTAYRQRPRAPCQRRRTRRQVHQQIRVQLRHQRLGQHRQRDHERDGFLQIHLQ